MKSKILSLEDFRSAARRKLPHLLYGFVAGGSETESSVRANDTSFGNYAFVPRVLVDVSRRSQATTLLGVTYGSPFGIAPMGVSALSAYQSDIVTARAAASANIPFVLSASSLIPLEQVRAAGSTAWYQAYLPGEPKRIEALVDRVAGAGFDTLVLTCDVPVAANRENNERSGFSVPLRPSLRLIIDGLTHPRWLFGTALRTLIGRGLPRFENMDASRGPPVLARDLVRAIGLRDQLAWPHLQQIRRQWKGKLVVKGILSVQDAALAHDAGADGIIVSNHGGRQLDGAAAPLEVLPEIAKAVPDLAIMIDGGIRRGTDVLKALALGAKFVFVGRPFMYAAAVSGEKGVRHAAHLLSQEIDRDMALLGVNRLSEVTPDMLRRVA